MKKIIVILAASLLANINTNAQLTVTTGLDTTQLSNLLTGLGVTITNININCHPNAYGEFSGTSEIPITHGLMMTTGIIDTVILGMNNQTGYGTDNTYMGDADLAADAGAQTYNACVLEFDCIPQGDTLEFNFGFGSEEYPEYVGAAFNDIFAIYFTDTNNVTYNAALIPGTSIPVAINFVNHINNSTYYIDNSAGQYIQFDGITQNLHAFAVVAPGSSYHFKIAIADGSDAIYDSGVLLEAFSFRSTPLIFNVEEELSNSFAIYPVPVNDYIQIRSKTDLPIESILITDALGRIVLNENIQSTNTTLDVSSFKTGIYFLTGFTTKGKFTKKFIVQ
jgi:hypothetical protein